MERDPAYLLDMLQAAREAQRLSAGLTWDEFERSPLHQYALFLNRHGHNGRHILPWPVISRGLGVQITPGDLVTG
jgi:hypothetical protein